jgi:hypothetical protein
MFLHPENDVLQNKACEVEAIRMMCMQLCGDMHWSVEVYKKLFDAALRGDVEVK